MSAILVPQLPVLRIQQLLPYPFPQNLKHFLPLITLERDKTALQLGVEERWPVLVLNFNQSA